MQRLAAMGRRIFVAILAATVVGCGASKPGPGNTAPADYNALAKSKVAAVQKMADGVAKDPGGPEVLGAYEEFVNLPLNVKENPNEAKAILEIYNTRIKGKIRGEVAAQIQQEMARYQAELAKIK